MDVTVTSPLMKEDDDDDQQHNSMSKGGWRSSIYIIGVEAAERFAYYGMSANLITYLTNVLGESTATAAKNINVWFAVYTILPLLGAVVADSYMGRFKTILISILIYLTGLILLTISVSAVPLQYQHVLFFFSIYMVALGGGGYKPCTAAFGADQFNEYEPEEKKEKSSFFNWCSFGVCCGASVAMLVVIYIQDNVGWTIGFGIPAIGLSISLVIFLLGMKFYRHQVPAGSPLTRVAQVFVAAARKRHLSGWHDCTMEVPLRGRSLPHTDQFKFLDKATIIEDVDLSNNMRNNWRLCSVTQVEEAKLILRLLPIWLTCLMYGIVLAQVSTFFTKQGSTMRTTITSDFRIPPASLQACSGLTMLFMVPIYDKIIVPATRNITGYPSGITILQRIGIGIFLSLTNMVVAALVEAKRVQIAADHGLLDQPNITVPMSIGWLLPQYVIFGVADVFMMIGLQELFYDQMPEGMRSMGSAMYVSIFGVGSLLSSVVISIIQWVSYISGDEWLGNNLNRAHLDYYYWCLAGLSVLMLGVYICVAKGFLYKKVFGNGIAVM